uniref:Uncharacterized protein n=1 Tax=Anopheles minimus TaxID=112268 RepID=A0A182WDK4_9DIPT
MSTQSKRNLTANGGNVRRSQQPLKGDQLLCKCLEKGQEILRKVEELTVNPIRIRTVSRVSTHYQQQQPGVGATTPPTTVVTSSVMTQTHTATNGGGGGGPKNNHAPVTSVGGGLTKSLSSDNSVSSLIGVDGNDSGKAKSLSTGTLITTARRPSLTPPTISLTVTDGSCPPLVITAPQPPPTTTLMMATASSTKDSYHESDWSEDSGRMSNENLELFGGEPEKPLSNASSSSTVLPGKLNESLLGIFENSSSNGGADGTVVIPAPTIHSSAPYAGGRWNRTIGSVAPMRKKSSKGQIEQPTITINGDAGDEGEKVFFRSGVLGALEAKRDDLLSDRVIQLQAHCRGYLARRRLARRRLQELAVKCIQRNVRAFLKVRDWPWWRLLVRVTPLLAVHRTEEQLKVATVELQQVRAKLEKIEAERNELKATNHKLEARVSS